MFPRVFTQARRALRGRCNMSDYASDYLIPDVLSAHFIVVGVDPDHPEAAGTILLDKTTCPVDAFGDVDANSCMGGMDVPQEMRLTLKKSMGSKQLFSIEARAAGTMTYSAMPLSLSIDKTDAANPKLRVLVQRDTASPIERVIEIFKL
jgi:hypothetical protein